LVRLHHLRLHHGFPRSLDAAPPPSLPFFFGLAIPALAGLVAYRNRILDEGFTFTYEDDPEPAVRSLNLND